MQISEIQIPSRDMAKSPPAKRNKTKYPKIFQCTGYGDCKMTFTRSEHLARHIRKHTGERPFRCHCNRTFSRLDNLRQHKQTVHANEHHILHGGLAGGPPPLPEISNMDHHHQQMMHRTNLHQINAMTHMMMPLPQVPQGPAQPLPMAVPMPTAHPPAVPQQQKPSVPPKPDYSASASFRTKAGHLPNPITVPKREPYAGPGSSPPHSPMTSTASTPVTAKFDSPSSPVYGHHPTNSQSSMGSGRSSHSLISQAYPPVPQPGTPVAGIYAQQLPTPPALGRSHHDDPHTTPRQSNASYPPPLNSSPYDNSPHSYRSQAGLSGISVNSTSSIITPASSSRTNSWLSNVLCDDDAQDRPHTWGPQTNNRFSTATDDGTSSQIAQLAKITENTRLSTPTLMHTEGPSVSASSSQSSLPSFSSLLSSTQAPNGPPNPSPSHNRPTLSGTRSYSKGLVLPRPDSHPSADDRKSSRSKERNKPLPPLPNEAIKSNGEGMAALLQAADV